MIKKGGGSHLLAASDGDGGGGGSASAAATNADEGKSLKELWGLLTTGAVRIFDPTAVTAPDLTPAEYDRIIRDTLPGVGIKRQEEEDAATAVAADLGDDGDGSGGEDDDGIKGLEGKESSLKGTVFEAFLKKQVSVYIYSCLLSRIYICLPRVRVRVRVSGFGLG
jgi:hypothetical protein